MALGLEAGYLVLANVFLSTSLFDKVVNASPMSVDIHYARGWSLYPTRVHAKQLSIRGTDSHLEWMLRMDDVDFECSLLAFFKKEFRVTSVTGDGITFRARMKLASPAATDEAVRDLPPIASLGPVGFVPDEPPDPGEWDDRRWHLWTVRIDRANAQHVREVWVQDMRFAGDAAVAGGFYLKPIRAVEVGPLTLAVREGKVALDSRVVAKEIVASGRMALQRFDPRVARGYDIVNRVSMSADGSGIMPDFANLAVGRVGDYGISGEVEVPRAGVRIEKGQLLDGTHFEATAGSLVIASPEAAGRRARRASGGLRVDATVAAGQLKGRISVDHIETSFTGTARLLTIAVESKELGFRDLVGDLHTVVDLQSAELADAKRLADLLPAESSVHVLGGALHGSAHAEIWRREERLRGNATLRGEQLEVATRPLRFRGDAKAELAVEALELASLEATNATIAVEVEEGSLATSASTGEPIAAVRGLRVESDASHLDLADVAPAPGAPGPRPSFHAKAVVPAGQLFDRDSVRAALGLGEDVRLGSRRARLAGSGELWVDGAEARAQVEVSLPSLELESARGHLGLALTASARAHTRDWHEEGFTLDGARVTGTRMAFSRASAPRVVTMTVASATATAASRSFHPREPLRDLRFTAAIDDAHPLDPAVLGELLPGAGSLVTYGKDATLGGRVAGEVDGGIVRGTGSVDAHGVGVTSAKIHVVGNVRASAEVARWDVGGRTMDATARVTVSNVDGGFDPHGTAPDFVADAIAVTASARAFDFGHPSMKGVEYALTVPGAELVDARSLNLFLPSSEILAIDSGHAHISLECAGDGGSLGGRGHAEVKLDQAGVILGDTHFAGDFALAVRASDPAGDGAAIDLEGSELHMRNVRVTGTSTNTSDWSGDLTIESGHLALSPTPRLDGDLVLRARDASPLLGAVFRDTLPKLVAGWTHMPSFTAVTHVLVEPRQLLVSDLVASGGDLSVRGTYALRGAHASRGAFVVQKGIWSAGVDVDPAGAHLRLFGLEGWYRGRVQKIVGTL